MHNKKSSSDEAFKAIRSDNSLLLSQRQKEIELELEKAALKTRLPYPLFWFSNIGVKGNFPRFVGALTVLIACILLVPESVWVLVGVKGKTFVLSWPQFIQDFVLNSSFPNTMYIFWLFSPLVFVVNTILFFKHIHGKEFNRYVLRRDKKLSRTGKSNDLSFVFQLCIFIFLYLWVIDVSSIPNSGPPSHRMDLRPLTSRVAMLLLHGLSIPLLIPAMLVGITSELRCIFINIFNNNKDL